MPFQQTVHHIMNCALHLIDELKFHEDVKDHLRKFTEHKLQAEFPFGSLVILHYQMFGGRKQEILKVAVAVEWVMLALDILDDLQDQDHQTEPWMRLNPAIAMNLSTLLLFSGLQIIQSTQFSSPRRLMALQCIHSMIARAAGGQHLDLCNRMDSEPDYYQMVREKSASLVACASCVGTILARPEHVHVVQSYAEGIGVYMQLKNDLSDLCNWDGKNDLLKRKKTIPVLYLLNSRHPDAQFIRDYIEGQISTEQLTNEKDRVITVIRESGVNEYMYVKLTLMQEEIRQQIDNLAVPDKWKIQLKSWC